MLVTPKIPHCKKNFQKTDCSRKLAVRFAPNSEKKRSSLSTAYSGFAYQTNDTHNIFLTPSVVAVFCAVFLHIKTRFVEFFDNQMLSSSRHSLLRRSSVRPPFIRLSSVRLPLYLALAVLCLFVQPVSGFAAETLLEYEFFLIELAAAEEALPLFSQAENMSFDAAFGLAVPSEMFSGLRFLSGQYKPSPNPLPREAQEEGFQSVHASSLSSFSLALRVEKAGMRAIALDSLATTSATLRRSTASTLTLSTNSSIQSTSNVSFNAANIPLLTEPVVNVNDFADSLGIRRSTALGGRNGSGIGGIPYNSNQGYSFQAASEPPYPISTARPVPSSAQPLGAQKSPSTSNTLTGSTLNQSPFNIGIRESIMGTSLRTGARTYTLDEYLSGRSEYLRSAIQDSITNHYTFRKPLQSELMNILSQSSNVSIPIPSNPLTTIFGKPEVKLNANIEFNVRLGVGWNASNLGVATATGQVQPFPIFTQNVQSNITAGIGDKFSINLDNNTQRQFEFDNILRFAYEGEPDEIFRKIEVGNVTLNSNSTFINGSQALFGARVDFQLGPVFIKILGAQKRGQRKVASVKGGSVKQPILLRAYDYANSNFFIHRLHRGIWRQYSATAPELPGPARFGNADSVSFMRVKEIEVWESTPELQRQDITEAVLLAESDSLQLEGATRVYPRTRFANDSIWPTRVGEVERGRFRLLSPSDYTFDANLGRLTIRNLRTERSYGIAYRLEGPSATTDNDDLVFGTFARNRTFTDTTRRLDANQQVIPIRQGDSLVRLQMVYRANMQPAFRNLWQRQMQNIYNIGAQQVSIKDTKIDFVYMNPQGNDSLQTLPATTGLTDKLATVLGVDRVNNNGNGPPDGVLDMHLPFIFNTDRGEIIFPNLEPFRDGLVQYFISKGKTADDAKPFTYGEVYDTTRDAAKLNSARDRFIISGEVSGKSSNRIQIPNAFNLAPGSVKVKLDGVLLEEYTDYRVEYFTGVVEVANPRANLPNANLEIEYEQNDVFNVATKTMLGVRIDLDTKPLLRSRDIKADFGITAMNYTQQIVTERIRIGEEPMNNTMVGADGKIVWNADWLTKALDWLPFYNTKAPSTITASGEVAWMLPVPNNRQSDVRSDSLKPAVYIDDFEASQRTYSLGLQFSQWRFASPPAPDTAYFKNFPSKPTPLLLSDFRGGMRWYQFLIPRVPTNEIYPNRSTVQGINNNANAPTLEINFNPDERGIYNRNPDFLDSITYNTRGNRGSMLGDSLGYVRARRDSTLFGIRNRDKIWGGFMRLLSPFNTNFDNDNIEYLEIVMRVDQQELGKTEMFVDIGQISEDVIPNGILDTEDGILPGKETANGLITNDEAGEDVGLDGLNNILERTTATIVLANGSTIATVTPVVQRRGASTGIWRNTNPFILNEEDPARDDFSFTKFGTPAQNMQDSDFVQYNGLERSSVADAGKFPDTEILNANNGQTLMRADEFFRYKVNLNPNESQNPQIFNKARLNGRETGFITYRLPIRQNFVQVGNPLFTNIQYVRVWWRGGAFKARVADWRFVGSQWIRQPALIRPQPSLQVGATTATQLPGVVDTTLQIGFVSVEENSGAPDFYTLPPGVNRQTQLNNPDPNQLVRLNEQSLSLKSVSLPVGAEHQAARFFRPFDVFFYKQMKIFFHGKGNSLPTDGVEASPQNARAFLRVGVDTSNYYEYNIVLRKGWQEAVINLAGMTAIKGETGFADTLRRFGVATRNVGDFQQGQYIIKGSPTLTRLQYIAVGIRNNSTTELGETQLWANELRIVDPDINPAQGMAAVANITAKIADLGTVNATFNLQQAYFNRLEERFGNRNNSQSINVTSQFALDKFFPESWAGTSLPLSYTYTYKIDQPRFVPQNDVNVVALASSEAGRLNLLSTTATKSYQNYLASTAETEIIEQQFALAGVRFNVPGEFFLFRDFTNRFIFNFNFGNRQERSNIAAYRYSFNWRFQAQYTQSFAQLPIRPFGWTDSIPALDFLKDWTLYFLPNTIAASFEMNRSRQVEVLRSFLRQTGVSETTGLPTFDTTFVPVVRNFDAARQLQMSWKFEDNGLLNPTLDYSVNTYGTMLGFETAPPVNGREVQRSNDEVFRSVFPDFRQGFPLNLGIDTRHTQNFALNFRPRLPAFMGGNRFFIPTARYNAAYAWERVFNGTADSALNKVSRSESALNMGLSLRWKEFGNTILPLPDLQPTGAPFQALNTFDQQAQQATLAAVNESLEKAILRVVKNVLFNWEQVNLTYQRTATATNGGLLGNDVGGTGFGSIATLFDRLLNPNSILDSNRFGPSVPYQLGLVREPHSTLRVGNVFPLDSMFQEVPGKRPANAAVSDVFKRNTTFEFRLQRELWAGATLEISSGYRNEYSLNQTQQVNGQGIGTPVNKMEFYKYDRTFVNIPLFGSTPARVNALFNQYYSASLSGQPDSNQVRALQVGALNNAFIDGMDLFSPANPIERDEQRAIRKPFYLPAINWAIRWNGLEEFAPLKGILRSGSFEHKYVSRFSSTERVAQGTGRVLDMQSVSSSFEPLIGITAQFDDKFVDGIMSSSLRVNTKSQFGITSANPTTITEESTTEFTLQFTYTRRGFTLPKLPGLDLLKIVGTEVKIENDIEFALQVSWRQQNTTAFDIGKSESISNLGRRVNGATKVQIEPSARYTFSKQLTARLFFSYDGNFSEGAVTPGSTVTQVGIDFRITLSGGRNF
jgi:cell surface protein SprA